MKELLKKSVLKDYDTDDIFIRGGKLYFPVIIDKLKCKNLGINKVRFCIHSKTLELPYYLSTNENKKSYRKNNINLENSILQNFLSKNITTFNNFFQNDISIVEYADEFDEYDYLLLEAQLLDISQLNNQSSNKSGDVSNQTPTFIVVPTDGFVIPPPDGDQESEPGASSDIPLEFKPDDPTIQIPTLDLIDQVFFSEKFSINHFFVLNFLDKNDTIIDYNVINSSKKFNEYYFESLESDESTLTSQLRESALDDFIDTVSLVINNQDAYISLNEQQLQNLQIFYPDASIEYTQYFKIYESVNRDNNIFIFSGPDEDNNRINIEVDVDSNLTDLYISFLDELLTESAGTDLCFYFTIGDERKEKIFDLSFEQKKSLENIILRDSFSKIVEGLIEITADEGENSFIITSPDAFLNILSRDYFILNQAELQVQIKNNEDPITRIYFGPDKSISNSIDGGDNGVYNIYNLITSNSSNKFYF